MERPENGLNSRGSTSDGVRVSRKRGAPHQHYVAPASSPHSELALHARRASSRSSDSPRSEARPQLKPCATLSRLSQRIFPNTSCPQWLREEVRRPPDRSGPTPLPPDRAPYIPWPARRPILVFRANSSLLGVRILQLLGNGFGKLLPSQAPASRTPSPLL
jgi:hypothetical protein